jgi:hypothetical protein
LTDAERDKGIESANTGLKSVVNSLTTERMRWRRGLADTPVDRHQAQSIEGSAKRIKYPTKHLRARTWQSRPIARGHFAADMEACRISERHEKDAMLTKTNNLSADVEIHAWRTNLAKLTQANIRPI